VEQKKKENQKERKKKRTENYYEKNAQHFLSFVFKWL